MVALTTAQRALVRRRFSRDLSRELESLGLTKAEILAAVGGLDDYLETNATAINQAIPQPARGVMSTPQKARLMALVTLERFG